MLVVRVLYPVLRAGEWPGGFQTGRARQESVFYSQKVNAHYQGGQGVVVMVMLKNHTFLGRVVDILGRVRSKTRLN